MRWDVKYDEYPERWFAWHPVRVGKKIVWWEWVWRSCHSTPYGGFYEYGFYKETFDKDGYLTNTEERSPQ